MKFSRRGKAAALVAALVLAVAGVVASPASPAVAATCKDSDCTGKDPSSTGCSTGATSMGDSYKAVSTDISIVIRWSSTCGARWSRVTIDEPLVCCVTAYLSVERQLYTTYGYYRTNYYVKKILAGSDGQYWTPMIDNTAGDRFRVCWGYDSTPDDVCGDWVA